MREWESASHVKWYCRYHVVIVPKYRKKVICGSLRERVGSILRRLCEQNKIELVEGHAMLDHVHLCLSIPPKYSVAYTLGFLKGKSAIRIYREFLGRQRGMTGLHFWSRGYCVSTVGLDEHFCDIAWAPRVHRRQRPILVAEPCRVSGRRGSDRSCPLCDIQGGGDGC